MGVLLRSLDLYTAIPPIKAKELFKRVRGYDGRSTFHKALIESIENTKLNENTLELFERELETHHYLIV